MNRGSFARPRPVLRSQVLSLGAALIIGGCGEDADPPIAPPSPPEQQTEVGHAAAPDPAPGRLVRSSGVVTVAGVEAADGMEIEAEVAIVVPDGGSAVIQLREGGRVELDGPAQARVLEDVAAQVLLVYGGAYAAQPPAGNSPRLPLRVVSPAATVEIGQTGEVYISAFSWGGAWVTVLAGAAAVSVGESDNRRRLRSVELPAGRAVAIPDRIAEPTEGPSRLTAARAAASLLSAPDPEREDDPAADRAALATEVRRLDQALRWLEAETSRGRELMNSHRDAVREENTEESQRLQRALVSHSQALYRLRRLATARWERVRARHLHLLHLGRAPTEDPVAERLDRASGLLGQ